MYSNQSSVLELTFYMVETCVPTNHYNHYLIVYFFHIYRFVKTLFKLNILNEIVFDNFKQFDIRIAFNLFF